MKFMFRGHLFLFGMESIFIWTPFGDRWKITFTMRPNNPFSITKEKTRDFKEDTEHQKFINEMKSYEI